MFEVHLLLVFLTTFYLDTELNSFASFAGEHSCSLRYEGAR
jgi:hypothetical protein